MDLRRSAGRTYHLHRHQYVLCFLVSLSLEMSQYWYLADCCADIPVPSTSPRPQASLSLSAVSSSPRPMSSMPITVLQPITVATSPPPPVSPSGSPNPRTWILPQRPLPPLPATAQANSYASSSTAQSLALLSHPAFAPAHSSVILTAPSVPPLTGPYTHASVTASQSSLSSASAPAMPASVDTAVAASALSAAPSGTAAAPLIVQSLPLVSPLTSLAPPPEPLAPVLPSDQLTSSLSALHTPGVRQSVTTENAISELAALSEELPRLADDVQEKNHLVHRRGLGAVAAPYSRERWQQDREEGGAQPAHLAFAGAVFLCGRHFSAADAQPRL